MKKKQAGRQAGEHMVRTTGCTERKTKQYKTTARTLAKLSHDPDTNMLGSTDGRTDTDMTSPSWSENVVFDWPNSMSHSMSVESPDAVMICCSLRKRQHDK